MQDMMIGVGEHDGQGMEARKLAGERAALAPGQRIEVVARALSSQHGLGPSMPERSSAPAPTPDGPAYLELRLRDNTVLFVPLHDAWLPAD